MKSRLFVLITATLLGFFTLSGCGGSSGGGAVSGSGGGGSSGSPKVSFSASSLTFGDEVEGTASEPLLITLTNSGTAALSITNIAASANFAETDNCGSTLAAGANCAINVTLAPSTTGSVKGTVTFTDNAADSPQTVSLSGTAVTPSTLTGNCVGYRGGSCPMIVQDNACPVGKPAKAPAYETCDIGVGGSQYIVDSSTYCDVEGRDPFPRPHCQATSAVQSCSVQGQQCGGALPYCCSGFTCTAGAGGLFCQATAGANASSTRSSWDRGLADRLR